MAVCVYFARHTSSLRALRFSYASQCLCGAAVLQQRGVFIEHSTDPKRWRSPEKAEVKRRHPGVKLGSEFARIREQAEVEQQLVNADKFTDWGMAMRFAVGAAVLLVALYVCMEFVPPVPSPEYTPYVPCEQQGKGQ